MTVAKPWQNVPQGANRDKTPRQYFQALPSFKKWPNHPGIRPARGTRESGRVRSPLSQ